MIFVAGSVSGVLDITDAFVFFGLHGIQPAKILQGIASGLLGVRSFRYGAPTVVLGALLHFLIAFSAAAIYYAAGRKMSLLTSRPIISGLLYGMMIYAFMNGFVLPCSSVVSKGSMSPASFINGVLAIMFLVGLPISLIVWRSEPYRRSNPIAGFAESHAPGQALPVPHSSHGRLDRLEYPEEEQR